MTMFVTVNMEEVLLVRLCVIVFLSMGLCMLVLIDMIVVMVMELMAGRRMRIVVIVGMVRLNLAGSSLKFI